MVRLGAIELNAARISRNLTKHLLGFLSSVAAKKEKGAGAEESFGASAGIRLRGAVCRRRASWARATHPIPAAAARRRARRSSRARRERGPAVRAPGWWPARSDCAKPGVLTAPGSNAATRPRGTDVGTCSAAPAPPGLRGSPARRTVCKKAAASSGCLAGEPAGSPPDASRWT